MDPVDHSGNLSDYRSTGRVRSLLRAEVIHSNGSSRTECTVRDLSDGGARIEVPASVTIPEYFELFVPLRNLRQRVQIMWRAGNEIGVSFVHDTHKAAPAAPGGMDPEIRLKLLALEAETARLRAQMAEMQNIVADLLKDRGAA